MSKMALLSAAAAVTFALLGGSGCCQEQERMIEDLQGQVLNLQNDLASREQELARCNQDMQMCESELSNCRTQLQSARQPEPTKEATGWQKVNEGMSMINLPGEVLFDSGKVTISASGKSTLNEILNALRNEYAGRDVYVIGHTDTEPIKRSGWKDNLELSVQRGAAVTRYLISRGLDRTRVVAAGCGEYRPNVPNTTKENMRKNRRVEIYAVNVTK